MSEAIDNLTSLVNVSTVDDRRPYQMLKITINLRQTKIAGKGDDG